MKSDIVIHKNTSSLQRIFTNRISLVPITIIFPDSGFQPDKYEFFIKEQNNSSSSMDITTEHIQIRDGVNQHLHFYLRQRVVNYFHLVKLREIISFLID